MTNDDGHWCIVIRSEMLYDFFFCDNFILALLETNLNGEGEVLVSPRDTFIKVGDRTKVSNHVVGHILEVLIQVFVPVYRMHLSSFALQVIWPPRPSPTLHPGNQTVIPGFLRPFEHTSAAIYIDKGGIGGSLILCQETA
eukprot:CAMPEP_0197652046 /NCGR_PEP_ID=MMETSP1338-20131121/34211_1 /TAXON_ID=43686 ORGANISM="Pelagodinium beii, Strain RCC1491" /NCGR_SAMPLE_ID=MMETSP1338 /ASSEMBLY_ACC=CAM_ASM_000754 /LENGTH=139 /DNA_ID=CAMNT_0043226839 /DNA_START=527 /DNA_END=946 /DNA_ORIENTATION=+